MSDTSYSNPRFNVEPAIVGHGEVCISASNDRQTELTDWKIPLTRHSYSALRCYNFCQKRS